MKVFDIPSFVSVDPSFKANNFIKLSNKGNSFEYSASGSDFKFTTNYDFDYGKFSVEKGNKLMSIKFSPYIHEDTKFNIALENNGVTKIKSDLIQKVYFKSGVLAIQGRYSPYELAMAFSYTISGKDYTLTANYDKEINATLKYTHPNFSTDTKFSISDFMTSTFFKYNLFRVGYLHGVKENGAIIGIAHDKVHAFLKVYPEVSVAAETQIEKLAVQGRFTNLHSWSALCQFQAKPNLNLICKVNQNYKHPIIGFTTSSLKVFAQYDQGFKYSFELCN